MAERNDWDRERGRWDWDRNRNRECGERGREDWDRERDREYYGREPRWGEFGRVPQWGESRHSWPERGDYNTRGDWGRQGSWGTYGNRPEFERENEWRSGQAGSEWGQGTSGEWEPGRRESFGRYGGGLGGYGGFGSYGGGMGTYAQRGQFAGRGPKNWQRSDERIKDDVSERLSDHPDIDASEIEVMVKSAEVTLSGTVDHRGAKRLAEDIAQNVSG
jgi:hypothetical protein